MTRFLNKYEKTQDMFFLVKDEKLLEKCRSIWNKIKNTIGKMFLISNQFMM